MQEGLPVAYPPLSQALLGGAVSGTVSAVVNNTYAMLFTAITGFGAPAVVNAASVTWASFLPNVLAGLGYHLLARHFPKGIWLFAVAVVGAVVLGALGAWSGNRGWMFLWLTVPMHLVAGGCCVSLVPRLARKS